ncbi:MAG: hypothetical protein WC108_07215 [Bacteroidales bacterium]|jgi:hypothetical protein|nr:hypothetical protein [Bacteroidales bacterium]MDD4001789.1 hypothetical protein [Bacteroidales bacterium]MDD4528913.1 hypothetical protein [Bacteroidales bacterium]
MSFWKRKKENAEFEDANQSSSSAKVSDEIYAAIAMAIFSSTEYHDEESGILTIQRTVNNYSPWNSKIYALKELPLRK